VTHHENHEPWLHVGVPDVSQRFQPPWWSPGWCPHPLLRRRLSLVALHSRAKNSRSLHDYAITHTGLHLSRLPCLSWIRQRGQGNSVRNYCRWYKCDKRVYPRNAILIAYASVQKNAGLRVRVSNCCTQSRLTGESLLAENIISY